MPGGKTGGPLPASKAIFEPAKAQAAEAIMQPRTSKPAARSRKAGGRSVRISGYIPEEIDEALRDEMIRRTVAEHRSVTLNDVLCSILADWKARQTKAAE
jgi:hypothetical protein